MSRLSRVAGYNVRLPHNMLWTGLPIPLRKPLQYPLVPQTLDPVNSQSPALDTRRFLLCPICRLKPKSTAYSQRALRFLVHPSRQEGRERILQKYRWALATMGFQHQKTESAYTRDYWEKCWVGKAPDLSSLQCLDLGKIMPVLTRY